MHRSILEARSVARLLPVLILSSAILSRAEAQEARFIVEENFNAYPDTAAMQSEWPGGSGTLMTTDVPGGGKAVSHDGGTLNVQSGISVLPSEEFNIEFSADLYDFATNSDKRVTVMLRNGSGMNLEFGMLNEIGPYCARVVGFAGAVQWLPFGADVQPEKGWHRFRAVVTQTNTVVTLDLGRDGKVDRTLTFEGPGPARPLDAIRFGGLPDRVSHGGPVLVDNIQLALIPVTSTEPAAIPVPAAESEAAAPAPTPPAANAEGPTPVVAQTSVPPVGSEQNPIIWWIGGSLGVIILLLIGLLLTLRRGSQSSSEALVPLPLQSSSSPKPQALARTSEPESVEEWKQRALVAESLAGKQAEILSKNMMPELTEFAKQSLVQGLYSQRNELLETQKKAQSELAALEARLAALHLPLQERIRAYELRIAELEKEFETRGEEMRELIQATLSLVRQRLKEEKAKERAGNRFN
jgi:hypothetical protein